MLNTSLKNNSTFLNINRKLSTLSFSTERAASRKRAEQKREQYENMTEFFTEHGGEAAGGDFMRVVQLLSKCQTRPRGLHYFRVLRPMIIQDGVSIMALRYSIFIYEQRIA